MRPFDNVVQIVMTRLTDAAEGWQEEINRILEGFAQEQSDREIVNTQVVCPPETRECSLLVVHRSARIS